MNPLDYYKSRSVQEEIAAFLANRWAALEGPGKKWVRWRHEKPLTVSSPSDVYRLVYDYRYLGVRSFYGTIEVFKRLTSSSNVEEEYDANVAKATPFIDIDIVDENRLEEAWKCVIEAAKVITDWLCSEYGLCRSVYLLWSGAGMHLRINENAFSDNLLAENHPLDVAFAAAEYILMSLEPKLLEVIRSCKGLVKIENLVAPKRVFTAPLSLHRSLDRVAITLKPKDLDSFTPEWSLPENSRHDPSAWRDYSKGEADDYAVKALERVGRVKKRTLMDARATKLRLPDLILEAGTTSQVEPGATTRPMEVSTEPREPGRFQVMALLQAARFYLLTGDLGKAKSWGLNRAIFYAWAKYYGPAKRPTARLREEARRYSVRRIEVSENEVKWVEVGGEKAQVSPRGWFVMGGVEQRPEDFDRHVARRFEEAGIRFEDAWRAALEYVKRFPRSVLTNPQRFYREVYEPVRDRFVEKVLKKYLSGGEAKKEEGMTLDKWLKKK